MIMFVKQEQNTLVIIQYIACGGEPEHQTKFQEMKNLIKYQIKVVLKAHIVGHLHLHTRRRIYLLIISLFVGRTNTTGSIQIASFTLSRNTDQFHFYRHICTSSCIKQDQY